MRRRIEVAAYTLLIALCGGVSLAAPPVHRIRTDLRPLIRAASVSPVQFAVLVPHAVSVGSGGQWSSAQGEDTWSYALEVPTAVSLSFHAVGVSLPADATLVVRGVRTTVGYRASDVHRGELWSRVQPGAALQFTLTVPSDERAAVRFALVSLQAGYRALGPGVADHPYYRELLRAQPAAYGTATCVTNYECRVSSANTPAAASTVALLVLNQFQCTGTLINDVPGDNTPYVLTARHCITGMVGVADQPVPAAQATSVYWDATSACGTTLGSVYDPGIPMQTGAESLVEQQDAWLIRLDVNPVVSDAQFAGFDAGGGSVVGGYTVQHSEGFDKQFTAWFGTPAKASVFAGFSAFLETVNQTGNIGPGASGAALFDQNNHLVGSLTYGRDTSDPSGYESCPASPPASANGSNGAADFTALAAVWNSASDSSSSTGSMTIKSVLDPQNTGTLVTSSAPAVAISLGASVTTQVYGQPLTLTWSATGATQCTASGGISGDGWTGSLPASGSKNLTESSSSSPTNYTLTCRYAGARTANASATVIWEGPAPAVSLSATPGAVWATRPVTLSWNSNVTPCALAGGSLNQTGLAASGSTVTTQSTSADVTYTLSCGAGSSRGVAATLVQYATPGVTLEANGTDRLLGEAFSLEWQTFADSCTALGGAPGDGWAGNSFPGGQSTGQYSPQVTAAGAYTYTLTCSSGALSAQQSVTVSFENNAPYVTATISAASVAFSDSPADYVTLGWNSNLSSCTSAASGALNLSTNDPLGAVDLPQGAQTLSPQHSGKFTIAVTCISQVLNTSVTSTPIVLTVTPPAPATASISVNPTTVVSGETFTVAWTSSGASSCGRTGGIPGDAWMTSAGPVTGSISEVATAGGYTFALSCSSIDPASPAAATATTLEIANLTENFASNLSTVASGAPFVLTWSTTAASACAASGGGANGSPWSGSLGPSGSVTQTATTVGSFDYVLTCSVDGMQTMEDVTIKVTAAASSGGSGGGGTLSILELAALATLAMRRRRAAVAHGC